MKSILCLAIATWFALSGCGGKKRAHLPAAARVGSTQTGIASWYGYPYHGRRAADGEIYDMEKMTAAHRTLPFGTWVRVKNLDNNKTVDVRITDRGPFVRGRILDLSHAAAMAIEMVGPGTAKVKITVVAASAVVETVALRAPAAAPPPAPAPAPATTNPIPALPTPVEPFAGAKFAVQVGAFADHAKAERIRSAMESRYGSAALVMRDGSPPLWRVLVGREETEESAEALAERIRAGAQANADGSFVVRLDEAPSPDH
jgi:rare lipoprotein A